VRIIHRTIEHSIQPAISVADRHVCDKRAHLGRLWRLGHPRDPGQGVDDNLRRVVVGVENVDSDSNRPGHGVGAEVSSDDHQSIDCVQFKVNLT